MIKRPLSNSFLNMCAANKTFKQSNLAKLEASLDTYNYKTRAYLAFNAVLLNGDNRQAKYLKCVLFDVYRCEPLLV